MIAKKNIQKVYFLFILSHILIWTLVPYITNENLPLDTIEALAWGSNLDWGFDKHPPLSAFAVEIFYKIFGNQDWAFYLLSQIFVIFSFVIIFNLAKKLFQSEQLAFISILLLEGIFFYNFTTPEFNVNVAQLPFWSLCVYFTWRCIKYDKPLDFIILGLFFGLGFLAKYLFLYLIISIELLFIYFLIKKKIRILNFFLSGLIAFITITPHLAWLVENNFVTIAYGIERTGNVENLYNHFIYPISFLIKQMSILIPFFIMTFFLFKSFRFDKIFKDEKNIFLFFIFFVPIILMILTSLIIGAKIRTMWMTPFYLFIGLVLIKFHKERINLKKIKKFYMIFLFFFLISPITYAVISVSNEFKRTDYPGKEIARLVQNRWDDNFRNEIKLVIGDEWFAGNLSYHLKSRPRWTMDLKEELKNITVNEGVIYTGNPKILKNICPGIYGTIKPVGFCMIGQK